jgi:hypothetical protein
MTRIRILVLVVFGVTLTQCRVSREVVKPEAAPLVGMEGLREICYSNDTIRNILVSKAETVISTETERYEALVTIYAVKDSFIYISAVNNGFEIIRAAVDQDSIKVIDRLNHVVYRTPVNRRFGHQHPVSITDLQNIISRYFICDQMEQARDMGLSHIVFNFNEPHIRKQISLDRVSLEIDMFEFNHSETRKYIRGEKTSEGFKIYSNFMITEFEILAKGGTRKYNQEMKVRMSVNQKRYSFINL